MGQLSQAFIEARERVGWSHRELARRAGCRNLVSQSRLIHQFEMGSAVDYRLLLKIGRVLGFTQQRIDELIAEDEARYIAEWNDWADQPENPYIVVRCFSACYVRSELPEDCHGSLAQAEAYISGFAKRINKRCCLVWSRRLSVFYAADGTMARRAVATPDNDPRPQLRIAGGPPMLFNSPPLSQPPQRQVIRHRPQSTRTADGIHTVQPS